MGLILAHIIGFNLMRGKFLAMSKNAGATSRLQVPFPCGLYDREQENVYRPIPIPTTHKTTKHEIRSSGRLSTDQSPDHLAGSLQINLQIIWQVLYR